MPLEEGKQSKHDSRYCIYCQDQESGKLKSFEEVKAGSVKAAMDLMGKSKEEAEKMADELLPKLPRWLNKNWAIMLQLVYATKVDW